MLVRWNRDRSVVEIRIGQSWFGEGYVILPGTVTMSPEMWAFLAGGQLGGPQAPGVTRGGSGRAPSPNTENVTRIIQALEKCGATNNAAQTAAKDLAGMLAGGHVQVLPILPSNAAGNTTVPIGSLVGMQVQTIQVTDDASGIHKTQAYGNPLGVMAYRGKQDVV